MVVIVIFSCYYNNFAIIPVTCLNFSFTIQFNSPSFIEGITSQALCGIILISLRFMIMGGSAYFASSDNPASNNNSLLTRVLTFLYLPAFNMWLLLNPYTLCFGWMNDSLPLIDNIYDIRNLISFVFYSSAVPFALFISREMEIERMYLTMFKGLTDRNGEEVKASNGTNPKSDHHSSKVKRHRGLRRRVTSLKRKVHNTDDVNKNNSDNTNKNSIVTQHVLVIVMCLSMMIYPFVPATNLFFYVGFVVAEHILYIPSVGFCLLIAMGLYQFYLEYIRCKLVNPDHLLTQLCGLWYYLCLILTLSLYVIRTIQRNGDWYSNETLFRSGIGVNPGKGKNFWIQRLRNS